MTKLYVLLECKTPVGPVSKAGVYDKIISVLFDIFT